MTCDHCEDTCKPEKMSRCEDCEINVCDECIEMFDDPTSCPDCYGTLVKIE